jgi:hypothetical protein
MILKWFVLRVSLRVDICCFFKYFFILKYIKIIYFLYLFFIFNINIYTNKKQ